MNENSEEESIKLKQKYLRENILDKHYNAQEFTDYLRNKSNQNSDDLNLQQFTMQELKDCVNEFIREKQYKSSTKNVNYDMIPDDLKSDKIDNDVESNNLNDDIQQNNFFNMDSFVSCQQIEKTKISDTENFQIELKLPKKIEKFFGSYITYGISTIPLDLNTRRRYSEFDWLKNYLDVKFPNLIVPPISKKNILEKMSENLISKRSRTLEQFLNAIADHPILRNSQIFYDFLSLNEEEYQKKKSEYEKPEINNVNDLITLDGKIKVTLTNENEIYCQNIYNNSQNNVYLMSNLIKNYKVLFELFNGVKDQMANIFDIWRQLEANSRKYYESNLTYTTYEIMKKMIRDWVEMSQKHIIIMKRNLIEYFRYKKNEFREVSDFCEKIDKKRGKFFKDLDSFFKEFKEGYNSGISIAEKIEFFNDMDFSAQSSEKIQDIVISKNDYCAYANSLISEYERIRRKNGIKTKEFCINYVEEINKYMNEFTSTMRYRLKSFDELNSDGQNNEQDFNTSNSVDNN